MAWHSGTASHLLCHPCHQSQGERHFGVLRLNTEQQWRAAASPARTACQGRWASNRPLYSQPLHHWATSTTTTPAGHPHREEVQVNSSANSQLQEPARQWPFRCYRHPVPPCPSAASTAPRHRHRPNPLPPHCCTLTPWLLSLPQSSAHPFRLPKAAVRAGRHAGPDQSGCQTFSTT